jgi:hypothetical protein
VGVAGDGRGRNRDDRERGQGQRDASRIIAKMILRLFRGIDLFAR